MKHTSSHKKRALLILCSCILSATHAATILSDDFSGGSEGMSLYGRTVQSGTGTWTDTGGLDGAIYGKNGGIVSPAGQNGGAAIELPPSATDTDSLELSIDLTPNDHAGLQSGMLTVGFFETIDKGLLFNNTSGDLIAFQFQFQNDKNHANEGKAAWNVRDNGTLANHSWFGNGSEVRSNDVIRLSLCYSREPGKAIGKVFYAATGEVICEATIAVPDLNGLKYAAFGWMALDSNWSVRNPSKVENFRIKSVKKQTEAPLLTRPAIQLPDTELILGTAKVTVSPAGLILDTGRMRRELEWTGHGLRTVKLENKESGKVWSNPSLPLADWQLPGPAEAGIARLVAFDLHKSTDEGFATEMLEAVAEMEYPAEHLALRWRAWIWPDAPGIRTQLLVKKLPGFQELEESQFNGIDKSGFSVVYTSSDFQTPIATDGSSLKTQKQWISRHDLLFDNVQDTGGWVTQGTDHRPNSSSEIIIDFGKSIDVQAIGLQHFNDYSIEGCIEDFQLYLSLENDNWGGPAATGRLERVTFPQIVSISVQKARYLRLIAPPTTKLNFNHWVTRLAEIYIYSTETPLPHDISPRVDFIPCPAGNTKRIYAGLYSDTQNRNRPDTPLLREETKSGDIDKKEAVDWASIAALEQNGDGVIMVKESHKTPNQPGSDTGAFHLDNRGLSDTGWGRLPSGGQITDDWGELWADWVIVYSGGESEREFTLKEFDRIRFPYDAAKESLVKCNSWATHHVGAAKESRVLEDLPAAKECGVEDYQIDDGWQIDRFKPTEVWRPDPKIYPNGWTNVKNRAAELGMQLSLWQAVMKIGLKDLERNYGEAGFVGHKFDFADLETPAQRDETIGKVRSFIQHTGHRARANWDVTEIPPRFGYFWAREYGRLWLKNAKPLSPIQTVYTPSRVLADAWQLSHYMNMRMIELPICNPKKVSTKYSDAYLHPIEYEIAETFAGVPVFFESMYPYDADQRARMNTLLAVYKQHRLAMWNCIALPIGDLPDNASITGFQLVSKDRKSGYLLVYRERLAAIDHADLPLHFANHARIQLTDVLTGKTSEQRLNKGSLAVSIAEAPGFRWLAYTMQD